jgi:two-component system OmpR family response regulator
MGSALRRFDERVLQLMATNIHVPLALSNLAARDQVGAAHIHITRHLAVGGSRLTELALSAGMSKQAMGDLVTQCEAWGLVTRADDPHDKRAKRVVFTAVRPALAGGFQARGGAGRRGVPPGGGAGCGHRRRAGTGSLRRVAPPRLVLVSVSANIDQTELQRLKFSADTQQRPAASSRVDRSWHPFRRQAMRILIAEDDQVLADGLLRTLRASGAAADHVASGTEADAALLTNTEFDLLILDLGLPRMHGLEVLKRLRARGSSLPVLILTAADSVEERVKGLDYGADDYMAKPFSLQELEARVRALIRRGMGGASSTIKHGPLVYDQAGRVATIDGLMVELSARELGLLEVLLQRAGRLVSKDQLVERLCEWGEEVSNNAIEVYIHRLRKKIEKGPVRIATVRGLGYCLEKIPG